MIEIINFKGNERVNDNIILNLTNRNIEINDIKDKLIENLDNINIDDFTIKELNYSLYDDNSYNILNIQKAVRVISNNDIKIILLDENRADVSFIVGLYITINYISGENFLALFI